MVELASTSLADENETSIIWQLAQYILLTFSFVRASMDRSGPLQEAVTSRPVIVPQIYGGKSALYSGGEGKRRRRSMNNDEKFEFNATILIREHQPSVSIKAPFFLSLKLLLANWQWRLLSPDPCPFLVAE